MRRPIIAATVVALGFAGIAGPALARGHGRLERHERFEHSAHHRFHHHFRSFFAFGFIDYPWCPYDPYFPYGPCYHPDYPPVVVYTQAPTEFRLSDQPIPGRENCREYTTTGLVGGQSQEVRGTACREADGAWHIVP